MYVIFPADEIILLSYGVAEHPRIIRRPTLDILIDPIVPSATGIRPLPSSRNLEIDTSSNHNNSQSSSRHSSTAISTSNHVLRSSLATPRTPTTPTTPQTPNSLLNSDQNHLRRDPSPNQVSFAADFMNKSRTSVVDDISLRADDLGGSVVDNSNSPKKKNRIKNKISKISLGKLGRPSSNDSEPTSSRLREDLDLRISNPTFTRENLREKNFDAFFASGEPVYSLEKKDKQISDASQLSLLTPLSDATTIDTPSSYANSPLPPPRKNSIAALFPPKFSSRQAKNSSTSISSKRPKSVESSVKGDRCHIHDDL
jgi:hypothetical protein